MGRLRPPRPWLQTCRRPTIPRRFGALPRAMLRSHGSSGECSICGGTAWTPRVLRSTLRVP
eukprot:9983522-Lingulodinium_polyedra.AAC.1